MKLALGQRVRESAWGGGNRFASALAEALEARGERVVYSLDNDDVDLILITDPRARNPALSFTPGAVWRYLTSRNPRALVVHRINECDERKGTRMMNRRLRLANYCADHTVFIASWLRDLDVWCGESPWSVILNGADRRLFNAEGQKPWAGEEPLRIVTHHWGAHEMKGFDVYRRLDAMLGESPWRNRLQFTYIGDLPKGIAMAQARHVPPLAPPALAQELRRHHAYLTASINEPAGMHHIEGVLCGLPLVYRRSGGLPEYCDGFGEAFDGPDDLPTALEAMTGNYSEWQQKLAAYPHTAERMCRDYLSLFDDLLAGRNEILAQRRLWRSPTRVLLNQLPW